MEALKLSQEFQEQFFEDDALYALSPVDGRYKYLTKHLRKYFSEAALNFYRTRVEIEWLIFYLENIRKVKVARNLKIALRGIYKTMEKDDFKRIKSIERVTNHDVKAIEYYIGEKIELFDENESLRKAIEKLELRDNNLIPYIHIFATSADINNLAYSLMCQESYFTEILPNILGVYKKLNIMAKSYANVPMLAHTHGQPASPTTVGKEFKVFSHRVKYHLDLLNSIKFTGKFNGATGNYNAHKFVRPDIDWINVSKKFIKSLGLKVNLYTTQVENHDVIAHFLRTISGLNQVLEDLNQDVWIYISKKYFKQKVVEGETGSSTMPHKVNPIQNEGAIGNIKICNVLTIGIANHLQVLKMQRDLSDSTVKRNIGTVYGDLNILLSQTLKGLNKLEVNKKIINKDLKENAAILSEAIQSQLREIGYANSYEILKELTRGKYEITMQDIYDFIYDLDIEHEIKEKLLTLTRNNYIGLASELAAS